MVNKENNKNKKQVKKDIIQVKNDVIIINGKKHTIKQQER